VQKNRRPAVSTNSPYFNQETFLIALMRFVPQRLAGHHRNIAESNRRSVTLSSVVSHESADQKNIVAWADAIHVGTPNEVPRIETMDIMRIRHL